MEGMDTRLTIRVEERRVAAHYTDAALTEIYKTGQVAAYVKWNAGYRLPTEAEIQGQNELSFPLKTDTSHHRNHIDSVVVAEQKSPPATELRKAN